MSKLSVLIPSRNEQFLPQTVADVLKNARGDIEVIVVLDGYWPNPPLPDDKRLILLHHGKAHGMRPAINAAVAVSRGQYLMKCDAHCAFGEGFDEILKADCADNWVVVPRRHRLEPEAWVIQNDGKPPIDAHYLSYPFEERDPRETVRKDKDIGIHGTPWNARTLARADVLIDDEMSSQGSCWFTTRKYRDRLGDADVSKYGNFIQEFQELGLKVWLGGGEVKVNKKTWYAHLHKGQKYGRGYSMGASRHREGKAFATRYWMLDQWEERKHDLRWLVEKFAPVPTWPEDLDAAFALARERLA